MTMVAWFILGCMVGIIVTEVSVIIAISHKDYKVINEEFVKKLIEKEGWMGAQEILNFEYNGKYMRIWRRLFKEHIEKGEN